MGDSAGRDEVWVAARRPQKGVPLQHAPPSNGHKRRTIRHDHRFGRIPQRRELQIQLLVHFNTPIGRFQIARPPHLLQLCLRWPRRWDINDVRPTAGIRQPAFDIQQRGELWAGRCGATIPPRFGFAVVPMVPPRPRPHGDALRARQGQGAEHSNGVPGNDPPPRTGGRPRVQTDCRRSANPGMTSPKRHRAGSK